MNNEENILRKGGNKMRIYKIYKLLFPGGEVYIGKTKLKLIDRFGYNGSKYVKGTKVREAIDKYGWENVIVIILHQNLTNEEACILESEEIENQETRDKISKGVKEYQKDHPNVVTEEMKAKISGTLKEYYENNPERIKEISEQKKKMYKENPEKCVEISERNSIPIDQYSYDGKTLIASYKSFTDAAEKTGINKGNIGKCANGQTVSIGGFRWKIHGKIYPIMQYDKRFKLENFGTKPRPKE